MANNRYRTDSYISLPYRQNNSKAPRSSFIRNFILFVIISMVAIVIITTISLVVLNPERRVKSKMDSLVSTYYEDFFYPKLTKDPKTVLQKYKDTGLSIVTLRQLLFDPIGNTEDSKYILSRCDENKTFVRYFPDPPYTKSSYHTEITYSCNF